MFFAMGDQDGQPGNPGYRDLKFLLMILDENGSTAASSVFEIWLSCFVPLVKFLVRYKQSLKIRQ